MDCAYEYGGNAASGRCALEGAARCEPTPVWPCGRRAISLRGGGLRGGCAAAILRPMDASEPCSCSGARSMSPFCSASSESASVSIRSAPFASLSDSDRVRALATRRKTTSVTLLPGRVANPGVSAGMSKCWADPPHILSADVVAVLATGKAHSDGANQAVSRAPAGCHHSVKPYSHAAHAIRNQKAPMSRVGHTVNDRRPRVSEPRKMSSEAVNSWDLPCAAAAAAFMRLCTLSAASGTTMPMTTGTPSTGLSQ